MAVEAARAYFGHLQAAGRSELTIRSYGLDLLRWFFGEPSQLWARRSHFSACPGVEDVATVMIEFKNGVHAMLTSVWCLRSRQVPPLVGAARTVPDLQLGARRG